ncbi:MAG: general secretion pathway protein GspK [Rickettsiales bacterium]|nr:general secretion pathway protein GspK [Rickettsiales bacterium]
MTQPVRKDSGAALITVMCIFIVAASVTMAMLSRQQLDIQRTANMLARTQALHYALGAEELARQVLAADAKSTPGIDHLGQSWAKLREGVPMEEGSLSFTLEDLQGRLNLNTLMSRPDQQVAALRQLLAQLGLSPALLSPLLERLSTPLSSIQSLRTIPAVTPEIYARLSPFIVALPSGEPLLNVNTASDTVLKAHLPDDHFTRLAALRANRGYLTNEDLQTMGINTSGLTVQSQFFLLTASAEFAGARVSLASVLLRQADGAGGVRFRVISRTLGRKP